MTLQLEDKIDMKNKKKHLFTKQINTRKHLIINVKCSSAEKNREQHQTLSIEAHLHNCYNLFLDKTQPI